MKWITHVVITLVFVSQISCTSMLWERTDPKESLWISCNDITEEELIARGVQYEIYDSEKYQGYLVEQDAIDRLKDYSLRLFGTPITLTVDVAGCVVVVGAFVVVSGAPTILQSIADSVND